MTCVNQHALQKMWLYSKLVKLLSGQLPGLATPCTIKYTFCKDGMVHYIIFTMNNIPCLLNLEDKPVHMDSMVKDNIVISPWENDPIHFNAVLAGDDQVSIVKEVKINHSPQAMIDFIQRLAPSIKVLPYTIAMVSNEYLVVLNQHEQILSFHTSRPCSPISLLIGVDIRVLMQNNTILEIERMYKNLVQIIQDANTDYIHKLQQLLCKCQEVRIVSKGRKNQSDPILYNIKTVVAHKAIELALECFDP